MELVFSAYRRPTFTPRSLCATLHTFNFQLIIFKTICPRSKCNSHHGNILPEEYKYHIELFFSSVSLVFLLKPQLYGLLLLKIFQILHKFIDYPVWSRCSGCNTCRFFAGQNTYIELVPVLKVKSVLIDFFAQLRQSARVGAFQTPKNEHSTADSCLFIASLHKVLITFSSLKLLLPIAPSILPK